MPASKAEQVLEAIRVLLQAMPGATIERNSGLPEKIPAGGLLILRDGIRASRSRPSAASAARTTSMRSSSRSTSRRVMRRRATLPSTPSSRRSARPSKPTQPRRPRLRLDVWPAGAGNRGGGGRTGTQDRNAHRDRRLRERRSSLSEREHQNQQRRYSKLLDQVHSSVDALDHRLAF